MYFCGLSETHDDVSGASNTLQTAVIRSVRSQTIRGRSPSSSPLLGLNPQTQVHAIKGRLSEPAAFTFSADWAVLARDSRIREAGKPEIRRWVNVKIKIWYKKHQKSNKCPVRVSLFVHFLSCCMCLFCFLCCCLTDWCGLLFVFVLFVFIFALFVCLFVLFYSLTAVKRLGASCCRLMLYK